MTDTERSTTSEIEYLSINVWGIIPREIKEVPVGNAKIFKITTQDDKIVIFKQMRSEMVGSKTRIEEILNTQEYFAKEGLLVVRPIQTKDGKFYFEQNGNFTTVYPFINSQQKTHKSELDQTNLDSLAETLAKLHIAGAKTDAPRVNKVFEGWKSLDKFDANIEVVREEIEKRKRSGSLNEIDNIILNALDTKQKMIHSIDLKYEDLGLKSNHLTHGDYQERNIFFDLKGNVEWIIDFDACEMAPRSRELARAIDLLCINRSDFTESGLENARRFYQKYNAIYPVTTDEFYKGYIANVMKTGVSLFYYKEYYFQNDSRVIQPIREENVSQILVQFQDLRRIVDFIAS
jgi:Ser/Thr protein kinase RdoA (MazF antagonist)